jgi:starch phosphorylase
VEPLVRISTQPGAPFRLPPQFEGLRRLAYNLWWMWHPRAALLFQRIDANNWARYRNPIALLESAINWDPLLDDPIFIAEYHAVLESLDDYLAGGSDHWFQRTHAARLDGPIAYFCAEYGFHESLGIYSGGLGVLAGEHIKTASDMALPFVGVGLLYRKGYFRQTIDADGHQEHAYPDFDLARLPFLRVLDRLGDPLFVPIELPGRTITAAVWLLHVGRIPVLFLDTDHPGNDEPDRHTTHILYVRGRETRLYQELVLGVGGVRALRALRVEPAAWHLNEGHSAFLLVERARELVAAGRPLAEAWEEVTRSSVFTIHTPVSAGNERFDHDLVRRVAGPLCDGDGRHGTGGVPVSEVLELGRGPDGDTGQFDMTAFCLRRSRVANAVSRLHAETANDTWQAMLGGRRIRAITNGVHAPTWVGRSLRDLYERYLNTNLDDLNGVSDAERFWERVGRIPDRDLWEAHHHQKRELAAFVSQHLVDQMARHGEPPSVLAELLHAIDPDVLTIGFARRFATYKRPGLLFTDLERLARLVRDPDRPVQFLFAGKAHPADRPGQQVIQSIFTGSRAAELRGRVFFLEDYDMRIAKAMVRGVDVWLNNPRRPLEASGTSGMKGAMNGVINLSVLDGWWDEGWVGDNGWAIGGRVTSQDEAAQAWADAVDLYRILESEVVPLYYDRDPNDLPRGWLELMKRSIATTIWRFSTTRMLHEYVELAYLPAAGVEVAAAPRREVITEAG